MGYLLWWGRYGSGETLNYVREDTLISGRIHMVVQQYIHPGFMAGSIRGKRYAMLIKLLDCWPIDAAARLQDPTHM